jgi:hypothetical protein
LEDRRWENERRIPKVRRRRTANPKPATPRQARQQKQAKEQEREMEESGEENAA